MRQPEGWAEMNAHLEDAHGIDGGLLDEVLDAEDARRLHDRLHQLGSFEPGKKHEHEV